MAAFQNPLQDFPSTLLNPDSRAYTNDNTYAGYVVDIAILQTTLNTISEPKDIYTLNLNPVFLSYAGFKALFYNNGVHFSPMPHLSDTTIHKIGSKYTLNSARTISTNATECGRCELNIDGSFNLLAALLQAYTTDLNLATECWETCSLMEFYNTVSQVKGLTDITGPCGLTVLCALTLDEFFGQLEMQGLKMSGKPWYLPMDPSNINVFAGDKRPSIYPGLVTAVITANFHSTTPGVKDLQVRWPFVINFNSVAYVDGSANTYKDLSGNINNNGTPKPGGSYPFYYYIDNNFTTGATPSATVPSYYRSGDLSSSTVDICNNVFIPRDVSGQFPEYNRYSANRYSGIFWEVNNTN
jgi:hypothetical protein